VPGIQAAFHPLPSQDGTGPFSRAMLWRFLAHAAVRTASCDLSASVDSVYQQSVIDRRDGACVAVLLPTARGGWCSADVAQDGYFDTAVICAPVSR